MMSTHGVPNDVLSNLDPLALVIRVFIPIFDVVVRCFLVGVYSLARRYSLTFQLKKITAGFFTGAVSRSMVWAESIHNLLPRIGDTKQDARMKLLMETFCRGSGVDSSAFPMAFARSTRARAS